jgi:DNA-binding CsgD family transcriptional regulator/tetratricopeptide (TPR) repeat protein/energy-coupling factor transporter ATP-binding protein EcfA2
MEMVERAPQLDRLRDALAAATNGHGRSVLLSGEAGVGKTTLLRAFADVATAKSRVFEGRCDELSTPRTLGPFRDIVRDHHLVSDGVSLDERDTIIDVLRAEMSFAQRPAVVTIEDLQWADHASLDIVGYLARRIHELPALLVLTYRDEEVRDNHRLQRLLGSLTGPSCVRIRLDGLSDAAVGALARTADLDPASVIAAVGGNPFYLSEVIMDGGIAVPLSVRDAVMARVATLPVAGRRALGQISVIPNEIETGLLRYVVDDPHDLEPAEHRGILQATGRGLRFRHEIARQAVESSLSDAQRVAAHARVLSALLEEGAEPSVLAHHALGARDFGAVTEFADRAAVDAARVDSHVETVAFARLAIEYGRGLADSDRARLHGLAAHALHALNRFGEAATHADHAVDVWKATEVPPPAQGHALLISARMSTLLAEPAAARYKAMQAIATLEPHGPSHDLALAYSTVAAQDTLRGHFIGAAEWSRRALAVAQLTNSDDVVSHAMGYRGVAKCVTGDDSGLIDLQTAVEIATNIGHADYLSVAAHNLAVMLMRWGRVLEARPYLDMADRVATEHRLEMVRFRIAAQRSYVLMWQGRWDEAEPRLRTLVDSAADAGANAIHPLAFLGRLLARRGDPAAAALIDRARDLAAASGEDQKNAIAAAAIIERSWLTGDTAAVRELGIQLLPLAIRTHHRYLRAETLRYLARVGEPVTAFPGCPEPIAAGIAGDWRTAAELWREAGNPYEQGWELAESPDVAVVIEALDIFDRLGATAAGGIVRRRLRLAGVRNIPRGQRPTTRANPGRLTNRQVDILGLLGEGCTNAEIAERLFLSRRTVDNHVSALLRKLGVTSRHEAADAARSGRFVGQT